MKLKNAGHGPRDDQRVREALAEKDYFSVCPTAPEIPTGWSPASIIVPADWVLIIEKTDGKMLRSQDGLRVIISVQVELDRKPWLHVSFSRRDRLPNWFDTCRVKDLFIGSDKTALQVVPAKAKHVNLHEQCLHLWHCMLGDVTPDFTQDTGFI